MAFEQGQNFLLSLGKTTDEDLLERIVRLERMWSTMSPQDRHYWLIDAGMRLGWLASRTCTTHQLATLDMLIARFRRLEKREG